MRIPSSYLRQTLVTLLTGNVTYNDGEGFSGVVPVVATDGVESKYQIFIHDYSDTTVNNKHVNAANGIQTIEVFEMNAVSKRYKNVDAIGEMVTDLILPTSLKGTDFNVIVYRPSIQHLAEQNGDGTYVNRLLLQYNLLISHN